MHHTCLYNTIRSCLLCHSSTYVYTSTCKYSYYTRLHTKASKAFGSHGNNTGHRNHCRQILQEAVLCFLGEGMGTKSLSPHGQLVFASQVSMHDSARKQAHTNTKHRHARTHYTHTQLNLKIKEGSSNKE